MAFPKKFKALLETKPDQVEEPESVWITYAVCGVEQDSCEWAGWILDIVRGESKELTADTRQICPACGKDTFRTEVSIKLKPSDDQSRRYVAGRDYDTVPIEYE